MKPIGLIATAVTAALCQAQPAAAGTAATNLTLGPLVSFQPIGSVPGPPYLDNGLGGTEPGLFLALEHRAAWGGSLALELSTTTPMEVDQSGRFVSRESGAPCNQAGNSCGPAQARMTDTLASVLFGARLPLGSVAIEPKAGIGLSLGTPHQGSLEIEMDRLALSAGLDLAVPIGARFELVPSFRYTWVRREHDDTPGIPPSALGLGNDILRAGVGLRFRLGH